MADVPTVVYWDSCVIIHRIQRTPEHIGVLEYLTDEAEKNRLLIVVSTFTIAEVVKVDVEPPLTEEQDKLIYDYFENDYIVIRPLTIPIARLAREITRKHNIKPKDAVHVATAVFWNVPLLHTYDNNLCKKTGLIGEPSLTIENPCYVNRVPLFAVLQGLPALISGKPELVAAANDAMPSQPNAVASEEEPEPEPQTDESKIRRKIVFDGEESETNPDTQTAQLPQQAIAESDEKPSEA